MLRRPLTQQIQQEDRLRSEAMAALSRIANTAGFYHTRQRDVGRGESVEEKRQGISD